MEIFGAMIIPFMACAILMIFFQHKTKWWELAIPLVISVILCGGAKVLAEYGATRDSELWGGWVLSSHYYEDWNEYIQRTCYRTSCSGSGKNQVCTQIPYDCSYVAYHPEYWTIQDSNEVEHNVSQSTYNHLVELFGVKPQFIDLGRYYYTNDGDMYQVLWPRTSETVTPVVTEHTYENRVQAARSVFSYVDISREDARTSGLFDYPEVSLFNTPSVLGNCGENTQKANERLSYYNAILGREKELRIWLLCFQGGDIQKGHLQEAYWVGGNKNEVVVTVGTNEDGAVSWVYPFSWTDDKTPIYEIRDFIAGQGRFDSVAAVDFIGPILKDEFVRKHFADFSYLTVDPPLWSIIATYVVMLLVNGGLGYFVVMNEFHEGRNATQLSDLFRRDRRRYYR